MILTRLWVTDHAGFLLIKRVRGERLTYLGTDALSDLRRRLRSLVALGIEGSVIEAGCALGGSAIVLAASKDRRRAMFVYDVFGTIPAPSEADGVDVQDRYTEILAGASVGLGGDQYYGYQLDLRSKVEASFARAGYLIDQNHVHLVEGLFEDTIRLDGPVAFVHIDGDWYESVRTCLELIWPRLVVGGVAVIDDYNHWSGCRTAVDEFTLGRDDCRRERWSRLHLVKISEAP